MDIARVKQSETLSRVNRGLVYMHPTSVWGGVFRWVEEGDVLMHPPSITVVIVGEVYVTYVAHLFR